MKKLLSALALVAAMLFSSTNSEAQFRKFTPTPKVLEVCVTGSCPYATIQSAINVISGATATNRFTVLVYPGDYDEDLALNKSWMSLIGTDRESVRVRGDGTSSGAIVAINVDGLSISSLTLGGGASLQFANGNTGNHTVVLEDVTLGIVDGTENVEKTIDCLISLIPAEDWDVRMINSLCRTVDDALVLGPDSSFFGQNTRWVSTEGGGSLSSFWKGFSGSKITLIDFHAEMTTDGSSDNTIVGLQWPIVGIGPDDTPSLEMRNGTIKFNLNDSDTSSVKCLALETTDATDAVKPTVDNVNCIINNTGASRDLFGMTIAADADHANWTVKINGGRMDITGGASQTDIDQNETVGGFVLNVAGLDHAGVYTGAGTVGVANTQSGKFGTSIVGPNAAITEAACIAGEWLVDTTATMEFCVCETGGAGYRCVSLTDGGPTD